MVVPDSYFICEILLYSYGFVNASELARKICHIQTLASIAMSKDGGRTSVSQDFGLRSIRGITAIADNLKQKCTNISPCELPDIINTEKMDMVNWQGQELIKEVIATYQPPEEGKIE